MVLVGLFCVLGAVGLLVTGLVQADQDLVWASIAASAVGGLAVLAASIQRGRAVRRTSAANRDTGAKRGPSRRLATQAAVRLSETAPKKGGAAEPKTEPPEAGADAPEEPKTEPPEAGADAAEEKVVAETVVAEPTAETTTPDQPSQQAARPDSAVPDSAVPDSAVVDEIPAEVAANDQLEVSDSDEPDGADPADEPPEEDVDMSDLLMIIDLIDEVFVVDLRPRYHLADCSHLRDREAVPIPINEARADGFTPCVLCGPDASLASAARQAGSSAFNDPQV